MNPDHKKTVLRMIPYGIYVLTADDGKGNISAATVNWVTQTAFAPPLLVVGVKTDSGAYQTVKTAQTFALNMLGKDQKSFAFTGDHSSGFGFCSMCKSVRYDEARD